MKFLKETVVLETTLSKMKVGQIGIITTGWLADKIVLRKCDGFICIQDCEYYAVEAQTNVKIYPKGTRLEFEV